MSTEKLNNGEPFIALRHKFAEDLEEILQCMVCFEKLSAPILQCLQGHHVCQNCRLQISACPYCKSEFSATRNYLAEMIAAKFQEIKTSLIDPHSGLNRKSMASVAIQADFNNGTEHSSINYNSGAEKHPCEIGDCNGLVLFEQDRMLSHLRYNHMDELLEEQASSSRSYENYWESNYKIPSMFERALNIPNMGLFFLTVFINDYGNLFGSLKIASSRAVARKFEYSLVIRTDSSSITHKSQVLPAINAKVLFVSESNVAHFFQNNKSFTCHLLLDRIFG